MSATECTEYLCTCCNKTFELRLDSVSCNISGQYSNMRG